MSTRDLQKRSVHFLLAGWSVVALGCIIWCIFAPTAAEAQKRNENDSNRTASSSPKRHQGILLRRLRNGVPNQIGKNHELVREAFDEIVESANPSVVSIMRGNRQAALGAIITSDGHILTKASEVKGAVDCRIPGHGIVQARKVSTDRKTDLVLLKVDLDGLASVKWSKRQQPLLGSWVSIPSGRSQDPLVIGVISTRPHRVDRDAPVLGVNIEDTDDGLVVTRVLPGGSAAKSKMKRGDIIVQLNDDDIANTNDLTNAVRRRRPTAKVRVQVLRDGESLTIESQLGRATDISSAEQGLLAHEGGPLSGRRSDFPRVFEHDCLVMPNQCGGPLVDVYGEAIGLNIARASRISSYALPKDVVVEALKRMRE